MNGATNGLQGIATASGEGNRKLVAFRVRAHCYAVPIEMVVEMTLLRDPEPIAGAPPWIRGMMQLRDSVVPILDLRVRLGLPALQDEVDELSAELQDRKRDHILWLQTLEEACATGARFELPKDPTQCAFGRWLSAFETEDEVLANQVAKFEEPHDRVHAMADRCLAMASEGNPEGALKEIDVVRQGDLSEMVRLFDGTIRDIQERSRQMVIILQGKEETLGLAVDRIDSVATVEEGFVDPRPLRDLEASETADELLVTSVVRSKGDAGLIQVLDVERVFASAGVGYSDPFQASEPAGPVDHG